VRDFVAFVLDGSVRVRAVSTSTPSRLHYADHRRLTQAAATTLAGQVADGQLPVPLQTVSVQPI